MTLEDFTVSDIEGTCRVVVEGWNPEAVGWFVEIVKASFPECRFSKRTGNRPGGLLGLGSKLTVVGDTPSGGNDAVEDLLSLLASVLTIEDSLDESHALAYHQDEDESTGGLKRSVLGKLVRDAKYNNSREARERIG